MPPITLADFKTIKLTRFTAEVTDAEIDQAMQTIAEQNRPYKAKAKAAEKGDRVVISFQGTIDGVPFEGGKGEDVPLVLGSGQFIPGFEDTSGPRSRRKPDLRHQVPGRLPGQGRWPAKRDLRRHREGGGGARRSDHR